MGQQIHNAGTADALRLFIFNGGAGQNAVPDGDGVHGSGSGPHAAAADAALQRRTRRACAADEIGVIAHHHFTVGADVQEQRRFLPLGQTRGQETADDIAAQIVGRSREAVDRPPDVKPQGGSAHQTRRRDDGPERRVENAEGIQAQEEVNHGGVAADDHGADLVRVHARLAADVVQQGVQGVYGNGL